MGDGTVAPDAELRVGRGDTLNGLMPGVYDELRVIARRQLSAREVGGTLSTTGLVHEAYLKLIDQSRVTWRDRGHFFALVALAIAARLRHPNIVPLYDSGGVGGTLYFVMPYEEGAWIKAPCVRLRAGAFDSMVLDQPPNQRRRVALWRALEQCGERPGH